MNISVESSESHLGRWTTARWSPPAGSPLYGLVERIWYFEGALAYSRERVFPDGRAELIVQLDEPHCDGDVSTLPAFPSICINGLRTRPAVVVAPPGKCRVLGICLEPFGVSALGVALRDLSDITVNLRDAIGAISDELGARCSDAAELWAWNPTRNARAVVGEAAKWMLRRVERSADLDPTVYRAERIIRARRGMIALDELGSSIGYSRARFARRFGERIGVTPKRFARIVRFSNALSVLGRVESIAAAATELAYFDQAHMYRDFEEFAGMSPGAFLRARRYAGSSSLAEA